MDRDEKYRLREVYRRVTSGSGRATSAAEISRETGIAAGSLYSFNTKLYLHHDSCLKLKRHFIRKGWMEGAVHEEHAPVKPLRVRL